MVYNGVEITTEHTKEHLPLTENGVYSYVKIQGQTYYLDEARETIWSRLNQNTLLPQYTKSNNQEQYNEACNFIKNNTLAKDYYIDAFNFTTWFKSKGLDDLRYENGHIITDYTKRAKTDQSLKGINKIAKEEGIEEAKKVADSIIKNTYRTLMTRGMKGCYVYCLDKELQEYLKNKGNVL